MQELSELIRQHLELARNEPGSKFWTLTSSSDVEYSASKMAPKD
jgi:hypothetical protein